MHSLHRSSQVRVLDEKRELVGVFSTADALDRVFSQNLDLILTVPNASPPVCRCGELALVFGNQEAWVVPYVDRTACASTNTRANLFFDAG